MREDKTTIINRMLKIATKSFNSLSGLEPQRFLLNHKEFCLNHKERKKAKEHKGFLIEPQRRKVTRTFFFEPKRVERRKVARRFSFEIHSQSINDNCVLSMMH